MVARTAKMVTMPPMMWRAPSTVAALAPVVRLLYAFALLGASATLTAWWAALGTLCSIMISSCQRGGPVCDEPCAILIAISC